MIENMCEFERLTDRCSESIEKLIKAYKADKVKNPNAEILLADLTYARDCLDAAVDYIDIDVSD